MSKEEIKALVADKLAGQGDQVDISGKLPTILDEIINALPEGGGDEELLVITSNEILRAESGQIWMSKAEAEAAGFTDEVVAKIKAMIRPTFVIKATTKDTQVVMTEVVSPRTAGMVGRKDYQCLIENESYELLSVNISFLPEGSEDYMLVEKRLYDLSTLYKDPEE